ncbi:MAG: single-strand DNA-binding protein [Myxococcales bacterium]|nr:single-strand DNA-binding protein [Myxococcales bacterium]
MAEGLNKVMLLGNLGADPELKMTQGGQAVLKLRLATTETYLDKNQTRQERTEWHSVTLWGKRGEALAKFLTKGERIFVEGSLRTSSYEKNGEKRYSTEINASNIILAGRGKGQGAGDEMGGGGGGGGGYERRPSNQGNQGGNQGGGNQGRPQSAPPATPADDFGDYSGGGGGGGGDDEIPF